MNGDFVRRISEALQFPGGYLPAAYLNEERLRHAFVAEVGEVKRLVASLEKGREVGAEAGPWLAKLTGKLTDAGGGQVQLTLEEAATLALVCRAVATRQERVVDPCPPVPRGQYVEVEGRALFVRPQVELPSFITADIPNLVDLASNEDVESLRAYHEKEYARQLPPHGAMTVAVETTPCSVACVLNDRWVRLDVQLSYNGQPARIFGQLERRFEGPIPIAVVAPLAIWMIPPA